MKRILPIFLCAIFLALPVLADNVAKSTPATAAVSVDSHASSVLDNATEIKLQQQKLDFFKERLDSQDKRITDLGLFLGVAIAFFGALITGVMVFLSFRSTKEAVLEAKDESRRQAKEAVGNWVEKEGKQRLEALLKPEIEAATKKIHEAASPILVKLAQEAESTRELNQQHEQIIAEIPRQLQELTREQKITVNNAAEKLESKAPVSYQFADWLTLGIKAHQEGKLEIAAEHFGKAAEAAIRHMDKVLALFNKGVTLGQMGKNAEAIAVYDEVVQRYGAVPEAGLREQVATVLNNKGFRLDQMGKNAEAIAVYDEVAQRYGAAPEVGLREQVATALVNKGAALGQMGKNDEVIAVYDEIAQRYGAAPEAGLRKQVAKALFNKGVALGQMGKNDEAIAVYDEVAQRYGAAPEAGLREQVAKALVNKGGALGRMGKNAEANAVYDEVAQRYGAATEAGLQEQVANALNGKCFRLLCEAKEHWQGGDENAARAMLEQAKADVEAALARKPDDPMYLGNQGYILFLQGDTEAAREILAHAIRLGGEKLRQGELNDAGIHPLPQDEVFKALVNSL